jgi:magnesium-transporting ATPase (P-type)
LAEQIGTGLSKGLENEQVEEHRRQYGSNQVEDEGPTSLWTLAWESVRSPMMVLLLSIAGISLLLGQIREALVMVFVVAMYVGIHLLNKARAVAPVRSLLKTTPLSGIQWLGVVVGSVAASGWMEVLKITRSGKRG